MRLVTLGIGTLLIGLVGCVTTYPISWKTLPEFNVPYEKAWEAVLDTLTEDYDLEIVQKDAGYIKTSLKTGTMEGKACRWKAVCKFSSKSPVKVKLKIQGTIYDSFNGRWLNTGFPVNERKLLADIEGRLRGLD